jgi:hypothetical protein
MSLRSLGLFLILASGLQAADGGVEWLGSYREGLQRAKQTGKPMLVEFRCEA